MVILEIRTTIAYVRIHKNSSATTLNNPWNNTYINLRIFINLNNHEMVINNYTIMYPLVI